MTTVKQVRRKSREDVSRRDFLRVGSLSVVGLSVAEQAARAKMHSAADQRSCIFILMTGGPSQFETFDPKPEAPAEIRGPLKSISTAVPGVLMSETLPRLAERAEKFSLLRSLHHEAAPIHETGQQLLQTGRLTQSGVQHPSFGSVIARTLGPRGEVAPYIILPKPLGDTGVNAYQGQQEGFLGAEYAPLSAESKLDSDAPESETIGDSLSSASAFQEPEVVRRTYGEHRFGRLCLQARQLAECGVRCVTVNLFDSLVDQVTWDCHAREPWAPSNLYDYRDTLCPQFDQALSALLDDLEQRGMLNDTLVVAVGEMGRTPYVNEFGGRDHWTESFSGLIAGGGVQGGRVIGATDRNGLSLSERPIQLGELTASIYSQLGLDLGMPLEIDGETETPLVDHQAIGELFA